ncbi:MAG: OmpA family protein [Clostridia bacterium]
MRHNTRRGARRASGEGGSFWLSFSDLMSALLLVFVLVMFYSVYQYLDMLEIKTAELMRQSGLLDQKQVELDEKDQTLTQKNDELIQKTSLLDQSQAKLTASEQEMITQQAKLLLFEKELNSSEALLAEQRSKLDAQNLLLGDQQAALEAAQAQMGEQQAQLSAQQAQMGEQQAQLSAQKTLFESQQTQLATQQQKLDALVGVRARIIASLGEALKNANVTARVDAQTGSITLDASVLFDVGKSDLKEGGKAVLDQFLPVYLSVLMDSENAANVAEIIIEGHTDTDGTYMANLKLSQERALSVMQYILGDEYTGITGGMKKRLRQISTANGRSFANPIYGADGLIDKTASRRVEFKFRLQDEQMIEDMRQLLETMN